MGRLIKSIWYLIVKKSPLIDCSFTTTINSSRLNQQAYIHKNFNFKRHF